MNTNTAAIVLLLLSSAPIRSQQDVGLGLEHGLARGLPPGAAVADARDYGADAADDGRDDLPALQQALDALAMHGGGTLLLPPGTFELQSTLFVRKPIWLQGAGAGEDSWAAGATGAGLTVLRWTPQGLPLPMIHFMSEVPGHWLHGGGMDGIVLDGSNTATIGVRASSTSHWTFDGEVRKVITAGVLLDDANGAHGTFNVIERLKFIYGIQPSVAQADGLVLDGVTQTHVLSVSGVYLDGDMVELRSTDNNIIEKLHAARAPSGTGTALRLSDAVGQPARNNLVYYMVGPIEAAKGTYGNRIVHLISEASSVKLEPGAQLHYEVEDYVSSGLYETPTFTLSDVHAIGIRDLRAVRGIARPGLAAQRWPTWDLPDNGGGVLAASLVPPSTYHHGRLARLEILFTTDSPGNSTRWSARVTLMLAGAQPATSDLTQPGSTLEASFDVPNQGKQYAVAPLDLELDYARGDMIFLSIERLDGDSATGKVQILGARLHYEGKGPDSHGSGPFDVSPMDR